MIKQITKLPYKLLKKNVVSHSFNRVFYNIFIIYCIFITLCWAIAADFKHLADLAEKRYGNSAKQSVVELESLFNRLRFASELEQLQRINVFFNQHIHFVSDQENWGVSDYWSTPLESLGKGRGDCEDYSIAKYAFLRALGIPDARLKLTYVKAQIGGPDSEIYQAHMVLSYYEYPNSEPMILDNLIVDIFKSSQRVDLKPIFSFNSTGLWVGGTNKQQGNSLKSLSRWRDVLIRTRQDGIE
jgi:predicted transglutaminase-like cysteine proteinase